MRKRIIVEINGRNDDAIHIKSKGSITCDEACSVLLEAFILVAEQMAQKGVSLDAIKELAKKWIDKMGED